MWSTSRNRYWFLSLIINTCTYYLIRTSVSKPITLYSLAIWNETKVFSGAIWKNTIQRHLFLHKHFWNSSFVIPKQLHPWLKYKNQSSKYRSMQSCERSNMITLAINYYETKTLTDIYVIVIITKVWCLQFHILEIW